ncbi:DUF58 domain-containing protein [Marinimicrobium alkaliphilum]|uniref:DUF58 domain-containing protein n=1 Tax=Marinimicrobium alkaliphilum TaxID=2202654 RepID=UPI000DB98D22|nr:DUF58 domain-containing protein [Marinimicrobium alkaliphilum]
MRHLRARLRDRIMDWADRRAPLAERVTLRHKTIYILPTATGGGFLLLVILLWLMGTNYENNLVLASAFLLLALLLVSTLHGFRNLSGLTLTVTQSHAAFAGEHAEFEVLLQSAGGSRHDNIHLSWDPALVVEADLIDCSERHLSLSVRSRRRGWLRPGRLRVSSRFPLGLLEAWSWVQLDTRALIYPAPEPSVEPPVAALDARHEGETLSAENREEFQGFVRYQAGAALTRVAWKHFARGAGLHLKDFAGYQSRQIWLDWDAVPERDPERRLAQLCYWVLTLAQGPDEYGLRLPGRQQPLGRGPEHRDACLRTLALWGLPEDQNSA